MHQVTLQGLIDQFSSQRIVLVSDVELLQSPGQKCVNQASLSLMKRILVIEDDPEVRRVIVDALRLKRWQPIEACDGEEGLSAADKELPDMVLCDIQMPKLDGFAVLRGVREHAGLITTPFLFLTGHGDKPMMRQAMEMGADDFIVKPFTIPELLAAIEARFQKQAIIEQTTDTKLDALRKTLRFALPHELVTPLNTILGFAGLLLDGSPRKPEQVHEYAALIKDSAERLRGLIEKFLVFAQLELALTDAAQRDALDHQPQGPTHEPIITVSQRLAAEHKRESDLVVEAQEADHRISASHLERILRELLENAFKFSEPGTPVKVESGNLAGALILKVTDQGRGFTPEQIRSVSANIQFDRKLTEQQGTGLGLAICRRLAELYRGKLEIQSEAGRGTTVTVQLPG